MGNQGNADQNYTEIPSHQPSEKEKQWEKEKLVRTWTEGDLTDCRRHRKLAQPPQKSTCRDFRSRPTVWWDHTGHLPQIPVSTSERYLHANTHCGSGHQSGGIDKENETNVYNGKFSAIKKDKMMSFSWKWKQLEMIMLNELSRSQQDKHHVFSLICGP